LYVVLLKRYCYDYLVLVHALVVFESLSFWS